MSDQPADNQPELFDLAAQVLGCAPMHLLKVRREGTQLVAILITGQKFTFDPQSIGADVLNQVAQALAQLQPPALPEPTVGAATRPSAQSGPAPAAKAKASKAK